MKSDDDECQKFKFIFEAFEKEVRGHNIYDLLDKSRAKHEKIDEKLSHDAVVLRRKIKEYTRYIDAYEETKKIYEKICDDEKHDVKCETLLDAHDLWHDEIRKYKVGWRKYYKKLNAIYDEMIQNHCDGGW